MMLKSHNASFTFWKAFILITLGILFIPLVYLSININTETTSYWQHVREKLLTEYLINTLILVIGTSLLSAITGVFAAWLVSFNQFRFRRFFEIAFIIPMVIPVYIQSYSYAGLFDYGGIVSQITRYISFGYLQFHLDIMNVWGLIFLYSSVLFPYVYLLIRSSFLLQSNDIYNICATLNKSKTTIFFTVTLPLAWPALFGSVILIVMEVLNDYGAVSYFGVNTFVAGIFQSWFSMGDLGTAIKLSFILIAFILFLIISEAIYKNKIKYAFKTSNHSNIENSNRTKASKLSQAIATLIVLFSLILPLSQLVYWTTINDSDIFNETFFHTLINSFGLALGVSLIVVILSFFLVFGIAIINNPKYQRITKLTIIGYTVPGAILSVGVILFFLSAEKFFNISISSGTSLFGGSFASLIFAYFVRFYGVSYNSLVSGSSKISNKYLQSAFSLGKSEKETMFQIYLPLIKPAILSALLFVFVDSIKELPLTLILRPFNFDTLSTVAYQYATDELIGQSAIYSIIIILISLIPILLLNKVINRKE